MDLGIKKRKAIALVITNSAPLPKILFSIPMTLGHSGLEGKPLWRQIKWFGWIVHAPGLVGPPRGHQVGCGNGSWLARETCCCYTVGQEKCKQNSRDFRGSLLALPWQVVKVNRKFHSLTEAGPRGVQAPREWIFPQLRGMSSTMTIRRHRVSGRNGQWRS